MRFAYILFVISEINLTFLILIEKEIDVSDSLKIPGSTVVNGSGPQQAGADIIFIIRIVAGKIIAFSGSIIGVVETGG
jgi:hypothetical protein